uniref:Uncharacterized protein n=1 Tax=Meloidogyne javanica TaxID=6303 RepID=A0A915MDS8_MELJA
MGPIELADFHKQHEGENGQLHYKFVDFKELGRYAVHSPVDNELLVKWQSALDKQIRLYAYPSSWDSSKYYHHLRLTEDLEDFYYQRKRENGQLDYKIVSLQELRRYAVHSPVDNKLLARWQFAIDKHIRLYTSKGRSNYLKYYHYLRLTDDLEGFYYQHKLIENGQLDYKVLDLKELGRYVVHSPVDNELLEKWQFVIDKHIRLFAYSGNMIRPRMYHVLRLTEGIDF